MVIIITGSMGCGKSSVTKYLTEAMPAYRLFDFDAEVHRMYQNPHFINEFNVAFGCTERSQISELVHADPILLQKLYAITQPYLDQKVGSALKSEHVILDIPLWYEYYDKLFAPLLASSLVICVTCNEDEQYRRIQRRSSLSIEKIDSILSKQLPQIQKAAAADITIDNSGTQPDLHTKLDWLVSNLPFFSTTRVTS